MDLGEYLLFLSGNRSVGSIRHNPYYLLSQKASKNALIIKTIWIIGLIILFSTQQLSTFDNYLLLTISVNCFIYIYCYICDTIRCIPRCCSNNFVYGCFYIMNSVLYFAYMIVFLFSANQIDNNYAKIFIWSHFIFEYVICLFLLTVSFRLFRPLIIDLIERYIMIPIRPSVSIYLCIFTMIYCMLKEVNPLLHFGINIINRF